MKDSLGVTISNHDIIAYRIGAGYRVGRAVVVGYTDITKREPVVMCRDLDGRSGAWNHFTDSSELVQVASLKAFTETSEAIVNRVPRITSLLQLHELRSLRASLEQR